MTALPRYSNNSVLFSVTPVSSMSGGWFFSDSAGSVFETFTNRVAADEKWSTISWMPSTSVETRVKQNTSANYLWPPEWEGSDKIKANICALPKVNCTMLLFKGRIKHGVRSCVATRGDAESVVIYIVSLQFCIFTVSHAIFIVKNAWNMFVTATDFWVFFKNLKCFLKIINSKSFL